MAYRLVFDIDGIMCDVWTPVENLLKVSVPVEENAPVYPKIGDYVVNNGSLTDFKRNFNFLGYVDDFPLSNLGAKERKIVMEALGDPSIYAHPMPMFNSTNNARKKALWEAADIAPNRVGSSLERTSFMEWAIWLNDLTESFEVILHTHVYNEACAEARRAWFADQIAPIAPEVTLKIDVGASKTQLSGTIVFEDNLENCLKSNAIIKVLMNTFHNSPKSYRNRELFKQNKVTDMVCVSNFKELKEVVPAWEDYLTSRRKGDKVQFIDILERRLE